MCLYDKKKCRDASHASMDYCNTSAVCSTVDAKLTPVNWSAKAINALLSAINSWLSIRLCRFTFPITNL
jgi:hypothetical protein